MTSLRWSVGKWQQLGTADERRWISINFSALWIRLTALH